MFDDDVWDFANVIGLPMQMPLHVRRLDFTMIVNLPWRMVAKELVFALLVPWHEAVAPLPRPYRSPRTLRRPARPLTYHAAHRMFERVNERAGTTATLHSLRHTAAYRMAEDPTLPLTDVQLVLGHAQLTTTQLYLTPRKEDVVRRVLAHHAQQTRQAIERARPAPAPGYRPE
jgi:integrase